MLAQLGHVDASFPYLQKLARYFIKNNSIICYIPHVYSTFSSRRAAKSSGAVDCWNWICAFRIVCVARYLLFRSAVQTGVSFVRAKISHMMQTWQAKQPSVEMTLELELLCGSM
jgi:hypothetical protein